MVGAEARPLDAPRASRARPPSDLRRGRVDGPQLRARSRCALPWLSPAPRIAPLPLEASLCPPLAQSRRSLPVQSSPSSLLPGCVSLVAGGACFFFLFFSPAGLGLPAAPRFVRPPTLSSSAQASLLVSVVCSAAWFPDRFRRCQRLCPIPLFFYRRIRPSSVVRFCGLGVCLPAVNPFQECSLSLFGASELGYVGLSLSTCCWLSLPNLLLIKRCCCCYLGCSPFLLFLQHQFVFGC
ncbi:unnamed protein product [Urochloa humidicola]